MANLLTPLLVAISLFRIFLTKLIIPSKSFLVKFCGTRQCSDFDGLIDRLIPDDFCDEKQAVNILYKISSHGSTTLKKEIFSMTPTPFFIHFFKLFGVRDLQEYGCFLEVHINLCSVPLAQCFNRAEEWCL